MILSLVRSDEVILGNHFKALLLYINFMNFVIRFYRECINFIF